MRNPQGHAQILSPQRSKAIFDRLRCVEINEGVTEVDTFQCAHCQRNIHVQPFARMDDFGSMCRLCMKMVGPECANGPCVPFEKQLEIWEARERARRSYES
jgi:hypothetical protein